MHLIIRLQNKCYNPYFYEFSWHLSILYLNSEWNLTLFLIKTHSNSHFHSIILIVKSNLDYDTFIAVKIILNGQSIKKLFKCKNYVFTSRAKGSPIIFGFFSKRFSYKMPLRECMQLTTYWSNGHYETRNSDPMIKGLLYILVLLSYSKYLLF